MLSYDAATATDTQPLHQATLLNVFMTKVFSKKKICFLEE
jgi:hypothetical protein